MKIFNSIFQTGVFLFFYFSVYQSCQNTPVKEKKESCYFLNDTIDFGIIKRRDTAYAEFNLMNSGNVEVIIKNVKADCGCTRISFNSYDTIMPQRTGLISVVYNNAETSDTGKIYKTIVVQTNLTTSFKIITLTGEIK